MKNNPKNLPYWLMICVASAIVSACNTTPIEPTLPPSNPNQFSYSTTQNVSFQALIKSQNKTIANAPITIYQGFNPDGTVNQDSQILTGNTDNNGRLKTALSLPADLTAIGVRVDYVGVISEPIRVPIIQSQAQLEINDATIQTLQVVVPSKLNLQQVLRTQAVAYNYQYLGGTGAWNSLGVPNNRSSNSSRLTPAMLETINATLPERFPLPTHPTHSQYIARQTSSHLVLQSSAEVWLTFVHEGAGYRNSVGYYTYDANNPPSNVNQILNTMNIAYPNASYQGSGGGLTSGQRVQLKYRDPVTQTWSNTFPANVGVGWFLVANGWNGTSVVERNPEQTVFSDPVINYGLYRTQGMSLEQSAQTVLLLDQNRQTLLLGFEDILRHRGGDQDFNDAVMLVEATPFSAIKTTGILTRDPVNPTQTRTTKLEIVDDPTAQDQDGDGVTDPFDAYPEDPNQAFDQFFPAQGDEGTLVFEDLWPRLGDYDFNDTVIGYNMKHILNANNLLVKIEAEFTVRALGGGFHSGFAFATDLLPQQVQNVSYTWERNGVSQTGAPPVQYTTDRLPNGVEANQNKAVFIVFDDGYDLLEPSLTNRPYYSNVVAEEPTRTPGKVKLTITLTQPLAASAAGNAPYNPFLIANGMAWGRGVEIHLPNQAPTQKADLGLFKTAQDTSDSFIGRFYIDTNGRPWAMNLPTRFDYLKEKLNTPGGSVSLGIDIREGYLNFDAWVSSKGVNHKDWFRDLAQYRNNNHIFVAP